MKTPFSSGSPIVILHEFNTCQVCLNYLWVPNVENLGQNNITLTLEMGIQYQTESVGGK